MSFCVTTDVDLPPSCPIKNGNGTKMNCSEGEYGFELFQNGEIGSREYELDLIGSDLHPGDYCLRSFVYFSDLLSNGSIDLLFDYSSSSSRNRTELMRINSSSVFENRWNELREDFRLNSLPSKVSFVFHRGVSNGNSFSIALDQLTILDQPCRKNPFENILNHLRSLQNHFQRQHRHRNQ